MNPRDAGPSLPGQYNWIIEVAWRVVQDPLSNKPEDRAVVCEEFHTKSGDRKLVYQKFYDVVPLRASDISPKGCTLVQAVREAFARKFILVPDFIFAMVDLQIGFAIRMSKMNVVLGGMGTECTQRAILLAPKAPNLENGLGIQGKINPEEKFGPETVFVLLCAR